MITVICTIIGILIGAIIVYLILNPKRIEIIKSNHNTEIENIKQQEELKANKILVDETLKSIEENNKRIEALRLEFIKLDEEREHSKERILKDLDEYEKQQKNIRQKELDDFFTEWQNEFSLIKKDQVKEYVNKANEYNSSLEEMALSFAEKREKLDKLSSSINAIIEANRRSEEIKSKVDFYRLQLSQYDVEEIKLLRTIEPRFRDAAPLNKVIYKVYYENQYSALMGRLFGDRKTITGIYKITNIENGMCYIGQSTNVRERFRSHIKCGVGAEAATKNKLYPALKEIGVENFTFELLEECPQEQLDEKEKFYIELYKAVDFGYNVLKGNG